MKNKDKGAKVVDEKIVVGKKKKKKNSTWRIDSTAIETQKRINNPVKSKPNTKKKKKAQKIKKEK